MALASVEVTALGASQASESKPQLCDVYNSGVSGKQLSLLVLKSVSPPRNGRIK